MRRERVSGVAALLLLCVTLVACSRGTNGPAGWLYSDASGVLFLSWTDANGALQGSAQYWDPPDHKTFSTTNTTGSLSLTGVHNGDSVSLTVNAGLGITTTWNGSMNNDELTLQITQSDGKLQPLTLHHASVDDYNVAVTHQQQAAKDRQRQTQQQAAAQAAAQQNADAARRRLDAANTANKAVTADLTDLASTVTAVQQVSLQDRLDEYERSWKQIQSDFNEIDSISNCGLKQSKAGIVESDQGRIQSDDGAFASQLNIVNTTLDRADTAVTTLTTDYQTMATAITIAGTAAPAPAATQAMIDKATSNANDAIKTARSAVAAEQKAAGGYSPKADALVTQAQTKTANCVEPDSTVPTPTFATLPTIPTITTP